MLGLWLTVCVGVADSAESSVSSDVVLAYGAWILSFFFLWSLCACLFVMGSHRPKHTSIFDACQPHAWDLGTHACVVCWGMCLCDCACVYRLCRLARLLLMMSCVFVCCVLCVRVCSPDSPDCDQRDARWWRCHQCGVHTWRVEWCPCDRTSHSRWASWFQLFGELHGNLFVVFRLWAHLLWFPCQYQVVAYGSGGIGATGDTRGGSSSPIRLGGAYWFVLRCVAFQLWFLTLLLVVRRIEQRTDLRAWLLVFWFRCFVS